MAENVEKELLGQQTCQGLNRNLSCWSGLKEHFLQTKHL